MVETLNIINVSEISVYFQFYLDIFVLFKAHRIPITTHNYELRTMKHSICVNTITRQL